MIELIQINSDVYKIDANGKGGVENGYGTVKFLVPHVDPVVLDIKYKNNENSKYFNLSFLSSYSRCGHSPNW